MQQLSPEDLCQLIDNADPVTANALRGLQDFRARITEALWLAKRHSQVLYVPQKTWVIDQMVRALTAAEYEEWVRRAEDGADGPQTYPWDVGVKP